jgi:ketosteroid isomerase-like protein
MTSYSAGCTFVGKQVLHGKSSLEQRYRERYSSRAAMGTLTFSNIQVQALDRQVAIVTGNWHLERSVEAGGAVGGIFSLVWQLSGRRWKIVLDHTA